MKKIITLISLCLMLLAAKAQPCQTSYSGFNHTTCDINPFTFNNHALSVSGTYYDTLVNFNGCDSIIYLYLNVLPSNIYQTVSICTGSTYLFKGQQLSVSGIYKDSLTNYLACDSIITLNLTVSSTYPNAQKLTVSSPFVCGTNPDYFTVSETDTTTNVITTNCTATNGGKLKLNYLQVNTFGNTIQHLNAPYYNAAAGTSITKFNTNSGYGLYAVFDTSYLYPNGASVMMWIDLNHNGIFDASELLVNGSGTTFVNTSFYMPSNALSGGTLMRIRTSANGIYSPDPCINYATGSTDDFKVYINSSNNIYELNLVNATSNSVVATSSTNGFWSQATNSGYYFTKVTNQHGCSVHTDSVQITSLATSATTIYDTICHGSFVLKGVAYNQTGTYTANLTNAVGCDSIITLNLVSYISFTNMNQNLCHGSSFIFKNQTLTQPGTYYDTLTNYIGCDSLITLSLTLPTTYTWLYHYLCAGAVDSFKHQPITTSGYYYDTLPDHANCGDSIIGLYVYFYPAVVANAGIDYSGCGVNGVTLGGFPTASGGGNPNGAFSYSWSPTIGLSNASFAHPIASANSNTMYKVLVTDVYGCTAVDSMQIIVINTNTSSTINQSICFGSTYFFNNQILNSTGIYYDTLTNYTGCDSIIALHLNVNSILNTNINQTICGNSGFQFNNQNITTAGIYYDTLISALGCDSIITLNLSITNSVNYSISRTTCINTPYLFNGNILTSSGTYLDTLLGTTGCDTFLTLSLIVLPTSSNLLTKNICSNQFYFFNNQNLNTSGIYTQTVPNYLGCDSIITLNLTVVPISNSSINKTICSNSPFVFNNVSLNTSGVYYDTLINQLGCDSILTLNLTVNPSPIIKIIPTSLSCTNATPCVALNLNTTAGTLPYSFNVNSLHGGVYNSVNQTICYSSITKDTITIIVTDAMGCIASSTDTIKLSTDCVWPGDANSDLVANNLDIFPIGLLNGTTGPVRNNASLIWIDQPASGYGISAAGFTMDAKHADCNGDGIIDGNDTTAILQNYGLTHLRQKSGADLLNITIGPDTLYQNTTATIHIGLGSASLPLDSVYGIAFSFNIDPTAIDTNSINIFTPTSWLFNNATDHFQIYKLSKSATRVDVGLVRNNHISKSGFGDVVTVTIDITTGNIVGREDALAAYNKKHQLNCSVNNITILKLDGSTVTANMAQDSSLVLYNRPDGINTIRLQNLSLLILPNPASNNASVKLKGYNFNEEKKLILIDATGRLMLEKSFTSNQTNIDLTEFNQGIYFVKIISESGISETKLIKQ